jgi:purine-binding chemotaxis protein CheW
MSSVVAPSSQSGFMQDGRQYLTFRLGEEDYAVEIDKVQEIKGYSGITPIPNLPAHVGGVMNLRGAMVPVMNLRTRLGMPETACTAFTVVVVVSFGQRTMGLVVDSVSEVLSVPTTDLQAPPDFGAEVDAGFIRGMTKVGDKLVVVLDLERLLGAAAVRLPGLSEPED